MTQRDWNIVLQTNSLVNGSYVRQPSAGVLKKVERAMYPGRFLVQVKHDGKPTYGTKQHSS